MCEERELFPFKTGMYNYCIRIRTVQSEWINQDVCPIQEFERQDSSNSKLTPIPGN